MGGTNTSENPTTSTNPQQGNLGAGSSLYNSTVMPLDLAGSSNNTVSVTDVSPAAIAASQAIANRAMDSSDLVTQGALQFATSQASRSNDLAASSTGAGPVAVVLKQIGIFVLGLAAIGGLIYAFVKKKGAT